jgi:flagellar biosynthesis regulator FlaF
MNQYSAYQTAIKTVQTDREFEASVFRKAALLINEAKEGRGDIHEALKYTQLVWSVILTEVPADSFPLPVELRQNFLNLGAFIMKRIVEFNLTGDLTLVNAISNINKQISLGLSESG